MEGLNVGNCNDCFFGFVIFLKVNVVNFCRSVIWLDVKIIGCGLYLVIVVMILLVLLNINMLGSCNEKKKYMKMCVLEFLVLFNVYVDS